MLDVAISFDTTGSMYPCFSEVKRKASELIKRLKKDIPDIRIAVIAHGDYCDADMSFVRYHTRLDSSYVTMQQDFTTDENTLLRFVGSVGRTFGGDGPECYEHVLHKAHSLDWSHDKRILIMIGDDIPHHVGYKDTWGGLDVPDWRKEARELTNIGVQIHSVQALSRRYATPFWNEMAKIGNGFKLDLDQFFQIGDTINALCYSQMNTNDCLNNLKEEIKEDGRMDSGMARIFSVLLQTEIMVNEGAKLDSDLIPVSPGRFQMLNVDDDAPIKVFVESVGAEFRKGRGFYQFTKTETIQEEKEIVLRDKRTGDLFTGSQARELVGIPFGVRDRLKPVHLDQFQIFVQSTSHNRKLKANTMFLYEIEDWEKEI